VIVMGAMAALRAVGGVAYLVAALVKPERF